MSGEYPAVVQHLGGGSGLRQHSEINYPGPQAFQAAALVMVPLTQLLH